MKWPLYLLALPLLAQDPVQWSLPTEVQRAAPGSRVLTTLIATIEPGWHLYSLATPLDANRTAISVEGVSLARLYQAAPVVRFDPNFQSNQEFYEGSASFLLEVEVPATASGRIDWTARARYQVCNDTVCLRPKTKTATASLIADSGAPQASLDIPQGFFDTAAGPPPATAAAAGGQAPVTGTEDQGLAEFLGVAFGFGLASVFTPCVFPMIPITMSFFLKRQGVTRSGGLFQATLFCLGIVVLFTGLGLLTTALLGPFGIVELGSNPWVNAFIALVFLGFGLSLMGAFEITLPSGLLTRLDQASQRGGILGTLLMGLTFSLTSFACVGPFVGTLLAASVQGGGFRPAIGMATFAAGLAAPFFFLALFPSYLQRLPKSGGWLPRVKVALGFVILAVMFKYLSNIDQVMQWQILTRDRFLAVWVILFAMPGLYLLGLLNMDGIDRNERVGVARALVGSAFLIFSLSLIPGMFGGRLGELDAYVPLADNQQNAPGGLVWLKNDYQGALAQAKAENKLVLVTFTGYACTNCHWMKANMFPRPEIASELANFVLVELYTDGTDATSERYQQLQDSKFASSAIPLYAILDPNEKVLAQHVGLTKNSQEFLDFLHAPKG